MAEAEQIAHLEKLRDDARDEIKRRIEQRDKYSVQLTIALAAIIGVALSAPDRVLVLLVAPLVSIYFTVLILYSYKIHGVLAGYLRDGLEPGLARLCGTRVDLEWETYYARHQVPGIRRSFFVTALWVVSLVAVLAVLVSQGNFLGWIAVAVLGALYLIACVVITIWSGKRAKKAEEQPQ